MDGALDRRQCLDRFGVKDLAGFRETNAVLVTVKQPRAKLRFEVGDLPAKGRLRHAHFGRGACEAELLRYGDEIAKLTVLHPSILADALFDPGITEMLIIY